MGKDIRQWKGAAEQKAKNNLAKGAGALALFLRFSRESKSPQLKLSRASRVGEVCCGFETKKLWLWRMDTSLSHCTPPPSATIARLVRASTPTGLGKLHNAFSNKN